MLLIIYCTAKQAPVVLMHGITDSKQGLADFEKYLKDSIPNLYVLNCEVGNGYWDSLFMDMPSQIKELTNCIVNDVNLKNGFIALAHSQGGFLMRAYLETKSADMPKILRFITLSSPLAGFFCGVTSKCGKFPVLPDFMNAIIDDLEYTDFIQNLLGPAAYWRNPYKLQQYLDYSPLLSHLDNEKSINANYKSNFLEPDLYVLFGSKNDEVIQPHESAWFGFFDSTDETVLQMEEREIYQNDNFGLKTLNTQNRIIRIETGMKHRENIENETFVKENVVPWVKMEA
ncbi:Palmitoyl-protein_thioesterase [Hexamita inflata]|uniref:Palmitoyl-protein thioesterase n=1 Tax=Hexamita inflata TaxID=28002 RepID=A0AA86P7R6_9EUKA|nr:Palmitoyl-protein thioesterase [Hexamita inflata]